MKNNRGLKAGRFAGRSRDACPAPVDCSRGVRPTPRAERRERVSPCRMGLLVEMLEARVARHASEPGVQWVLIEVMRGGEFAVVDRLARRGVFAFTPVRVVWRHRSASARRLGRRKERREYAAAPGYVVAALEDHGRGLRRWASVFACRGVVRVFEGARGPLGLSAAQVRLVARLASEAPSWEALMPSGREYAVGDRVRVTRGPLAGVEADVTAINGDQADLALAGLFQAASRVQAGLWMLEAA